MPEMTNKIFCSLTQPLTVRFANANVNSCQRKGRDYSQSEEPRTWILGLGNGETWLVCFLGKISIISFSWHGLPEHMAISSQ